MAIFLDLNQWLSSLIYWYESYDKTKLENVWNVLYHILVYRKYKDPKPNIFWNKKSASLKETYNSIITNERTNEM